jgi:hypothetical protein
MVRTTMKLPVDVKALHEPGCWGGKPAGHARPNKAKGREKNKQAFHALRYRDSVDLAKFHSGIAASRLVCR